MYKDPQVVWRKSQRGGRGSLESSGEASSAGVGWGWGCLPSPAVQRQGRGRCELKCL